VPDDLGVVLLAAPRSSVVVLDNSAVVCTPSSEAVSSPSTTS